MLSLAVARLQVTDEMCQPLWVGILHDAGFIPRHRVIAADPSNVPPDPAEMLVDGFRLHAPHVSLTPGQVYASSAPLLKGLALLAEQHWKRV